MASKSEAPITGDRGELSITLDGATYGLRPSYEALDAIEEETGKGLLDLARSAIGGSITKREAGIILAAFIRAWGREKGLASASGVQADKVANLVMGSDGGMIGAVTILSTLLTLAVSGGVTDEGEVKAATKTTD